MLLAGVATVLDIRASRVASSSRYAVRAYVTHTAVFGDHITSSLSLAMRTTHAGKVCEFTTGLENGSSFLLNVALRV
jgi:hypothetical protein